MKMYQISDSTVLDNYVLAKELMRLANISTNGFRYWKECIAVKYYKSRVVYIHKEFVHPKYKHLVANCTKLDGLVQSAPFCRYTNLSSSHLTLSNRSNLLSVLEVKFVDGVKFVNLKKLLDRYGLTQENTIYIEKCKYFAPLEKKIPLTKSLCLGYY